MNTVTAPDKKRRGPPRYLIGILVLTIINAISIYVLLNLLYANLERFEAGTPNTALERYFSHLRAGNYEAIKNDSGFTPSRWATWEDYIAFLQRQYGVLPDSLRYRKVGTPKDGGGQPYAVYSGGEKLGEAVLYRAEGGGWRVSTPPVYGESYTVDAPGHIDILVDGEKLNISEAAESNEVALFGTLPDTEKKPVRLIYHVGPMLDVPSFSAESPPGVMCELKTDAASHHITVQAKPALQITEELSLRMEEAAKAYANFVSEDAEWGALAPHLLSESELSARARGMERGWYIDHDGFAFKDIATLNFCSYSESCFSGEITFTYEVYRQGITYTYPVHYNMVYLKTAAGWKLFDLNTI